MKTSILKSLLYIILLLHNFLLANDSEENNEISKVYKIISNTKLLNQFRLMNYREILDISTMTDKRISVIFVDYLNYAPPVIQQQLLIKLAEFKIPATAKKLAEIAKNSPDWWVRSVAIEALTNLKEPYVLPSLFDALDDTQEFVQNMAAQGLNQIVSEDDVIDKNATKNVEFWKENKESILTKYGKVDFPEENFFYYEPIYKFRIKKLEDFWECEGRVDKKDHSIKYIFKWRKKDYDIWIWGEKDNRTNKELYEEELERIKKTKMETLKDFKSSKWKSYDKLPWTAYQMRYHGRYESDIIYFHSLIVIFANDNIYFLETADPMETKDEALKYFFNFVKNFELLTNE